MKYFSIVLAAAYVTFAHASYAAENEFHISIKDHAFTPAELTVPAGKKVALKVNNQDATPEEFESYELNREKIINGNSTATIFIGPLEPGTYPFFGEFNPKTAQGKIIVK
jgi:plastocyanin